MPDKVAHPDDERTSAQQAAFDAAEAKNQEELEIKPESALGIEPTELEVESLEVQPNTPEIE